MPIMANDVRYLIWKEAAKNNEWGKRETEESKRHAPGRHGGILNQNHIKY
jgi:hypothetical protein